MSKNQEEDVGEIEQPLHHSDPTTVMDFNQTSYFDMVYFSETKKGFSASSFLSYTRRNIDLIFVDCMRCMLI